MDGDVSQRAESTMSKSTKRKPQKPAAGGSYGEVGELAGATAQTSGAVTEKGKPDKDDDIHRVAIRRWQAGYDRDRDNIDAGYEDLEFLEGDQWPKDAVTLRENEKRPVQTFNRMPQFVRQITGDMRLARPSIKVVPVDSGSDKEIARIRAGLIRYIENRSDAQAAYRAIAQFRFRQKLELLRRGLDDDSHAKRGNLVVDGIGDLTR